MAFQSEARVTRQKQITSLAVYHEAVETVVEGAEYRWQASLNPTPRIQLRSGEPLSLLVQLPSDFPAGQPQVFIEVSPSVLLYCSTALLLYCSTALLVLLV